MYVVWCGRSSDEDSKRGEISRQLVELEREISLTTPLIAELDHRLTGGQSGLTTGQSGLTPGQSTKQLSSGSASEPTSAVELTVRTTEPGASISTDVTGVDKLSMAADKLTAVESGMTGSTDVTVVDKLTSAVDSGLQMASPASSGQSFQVRS